MYYWTINIEKTVITQKICFNESKWVEINNLSIDIISNAMCLVILISAIDYVLRNKSDWISDPLGSFFSIALSVCLCLLAINRSLTRRKLLKLTSCGREEILMALKQLNWEIAQKDPACVVAKPSNWKQVTIIFNKKDVLIHSFREGFGGVYTRTSFIDNNLLEKIEELKIEERNKNAV